MSRAGAWLRGDPHAPILYHHSGREGWRGAAHLLLSCWVPSTPISPHTDGDEDTNKTQLHGCVDVSQGSKGETVVYLFPTKRQVQVLKERGREHACLRPPGRWEGV